jgi:hypothetical protein
MNNGYIKLFRSLLDSRVFASEKALKIWVWLLLKVTFEKRFVSLKVGKGTTVVELLPGELIFGRFQAEETLCIDGSTIYKKLKEFEVEEMITIKSNSHYSIISICNWETYQGLNNDEVTTNEQPSNKQVTTKEQASNKQVTTKEQASNTNKKDKKDKEEKKEYISPSDLFFSDIEKVLLNDEKMIIFKQWANEIISKCSRIWEMPKPITSFEFYQLINSYGKDMVFNKLLALSNRTDLVKRHSAYLTVLNWCEKDRKDAK